MIILNKKENEISNSVERVEASVKWYNPVKGYGFLIADTHSSDIMIHFSTLDKTGCPYVKEGDRVICDIGPGRRGLQVVRVIEVIYDSPESRSLVDFFDSRLSPLNPEDLEDIEGVIKWYNPDKGYGFICPNDGGREIFLHFSVLRKAGYRFLDPGTPVLAKVFQSERGPETRAITVIEHGRSRDCGGLSTSPPKRLGGQKIN